MAGRLFKTKTQLEHSTTLASFLPNGRPFLAKGIPQTNLYKLIYGLAAECARAENLLNDITYEHEIGQTTLLIEEWESALGIPDDCFPKATTLAERRRNVLLKLGGLGLQTAKDFIDLAAVFGVTITIDVGRCYGMFPYNCAFPITFMDSPQTARFTWRVNMWNITPPCIFPFVNLFPICFSSGASNIIECFFNKLRPSNTILTFRYPS